MIDGWVCRGVGERVLVVEVDAVSKEDDRGLGVGGDSESETPSYIGVLTGDLRGDKSKGGGIVRGFTGVKCAANLEPKDGEDTFMGGSVDGSGGVEVADGEMTRTGCLDNEVKFVSK